MEQAQLTLEGMRQGVRDSDVFLLILTKSVLTRWFCQQELLTAIDEGTPVQLLVESDTRFFPFDETNWRDFTADSPEDHAAIVAAVEAALAEAVQLRRRDYEASAMMRELLRRNGIALPSATGPPAAEPAGLSTVAQTETTTVYLIGNRHGRGGDMVDTLVHELTASERVIVREGDSQQALADANKVLVLLSEGVLQDASLSELVEALAQDRATSTDRIVMVCRTSSEGWVFGGANPEVAAAPAEVQQALNGHEAITYRTPSESGSRHEFPAMLDHLLNRLAPSWSGTAGPAGGGAAPVATVPTVRQQLEAARQVRVGVVLCVGLWGGWGLVLIG